jgi:pimeloyl-ACP methyl ester carboxylesterase
MPWVNSSACDTWMLGFSMGGAVTIGSLERFPQHYAGGVSLCGANLSGEQIATDLLTTLVAFDYFFPKAEGLPATGWHRAKQPCCPRASCTRASPCAATRPGACRVLAQRLQVPDEVAGTISLHALVLHELATRSGGMPVGNRGMVYSGFGDDAAFNAGVQRIDAVPAAQARRATLALTGALQRPLVIQFNHNDPTIVPHMQTVYPQLAAHAGARQRHGTAIGGRRTLWLL